MAEDERDTERPTSPYHEKCFPPYCESALKVDKHAISKMDRNDLEDRYIVYADENFILKKQIRDHERQIQRLQTALARQDNLDKKGGKVPASTYYDHARVDNLESQNKHLQAKVKVLRQQLMNHSFIHTKDQKILENREKDYKRERVSPESTYRDIGQTQSAREAHHRPPYKDRSPSSTSALKQRIAVLEQVVEAQKAKYKSRIANLEKELAALGKSGSSLNDQLSEHSKKLYDNVEMIRLLRQSKEQKSHIVSLTDQYESAFKEIAELQEALKQATENAEELHRQLERERDRARDAQSQITKSISHTEKIRVLEEQIRDLQNEKKTLKDTNEQLLLLTTTAGTQSKSDRSLQENKLKQQISTLELKLQDKVKELEEKEEQLIKLESLLEQSGKPTEIREAEHKAYEIQKSGAQVQTDHSDLVRHRWREATIKVLYNKRKAEKQELEVKLKIALQEIKDLKKKQLTENYFTDVQKEQYAEMERRLYNALAELETLRATAAEHEHCPKTRPHSPLTTVEVTPKHSESVGYRLSSKVEVVNVSDLESSSSKVTDPDSPSSSQSRQDGKVSTEVQSLFYNESTNDRISKLEAPAGITHLDILKKAVVKYQTREDILNMFLVQDGSPSERVYSTHQLEEVRVSEPPQKPVLIIVSKHEFEAVLLKKKKIYSETEVAGPTDKKYSLNCKLEFCVYDLEMESDMLHRLSEMENDPQVFVEWSFLGIDQRTEPMPASKAYFQTNVTYCGPLSQNMADHIKKNDIHIHLILKTDDGREVKVGEGYLDLSPAIQQPSRGFLRCVNLSGDSGSATLYCSYKLHDCCATDAPVGVVENLEIGIGRLVLASGDIPSNPEATHLYVEYSVLGQYGPKLETDSIIKGDVMQFNYAERLKINEYNGALLKPLLKQDEPKPLRFILLAEPCNLVTSTEVEEVGHADLNLVEEMLLKGQDAISIQLPVFSNDKEHLGSLSVTVIGISTLQNYGESKQRS